MAPSAHKRYKKFDARLQQKIKEEAKKLSEDPHIYEERDLWQASGLTISTIVRHNIGLHIESLKTKRKLSLSWLNPERASIRP